MYVSNFHYRPKRNNYQKIFSIFIATAKNCNFTPYNYILIFVAFQKITSHLFQFEKEYSVLEGVRIFMSGSAYVNERGLNYFKRSLPSCLIRRASQLEAISTFVSSSGFLEHVIAVKNTARTPGKFAG